MTGPTAVVIGLDTITGLQTARILAGHGVPVVGLTNDLGHYTCRTRACERVLQADLLGTGFVDVLVELGPQLAGGGVLVPCTDLSVLLLSRHRDRVAPWYALGLPDHDVVELLMDKTRFLRHAHAAGLPIPQTAFLDTRADAERAGQELRFPVVLKPPMKSALWQAHTARKGFLVADPSEFLTVYDRIAGWSPDLIAQQWIPGGADELYSCNAYFDAGSRPLVTFVARKLRQWPPDTGTSSLGEEVRNDEVLRATVELFTSVGYRGLGYVELKRDPRTGAHLIIEPNVGRPTGRSAIAEAGGVPLLYTAYCDLTGLPLPEPREQRYLGVKWIDDRRDAQSALHAFRRGELTPVRWARSVRGPKAHAVASRSDPAPFLHDLLQSGRRGAGMLGRRWELPGKADRARHQLRRPVARTPYLWDAAMAVRGSKRVTLARRGTAIVIEGFLRSGNTFSVAAFQLANGPDVHVGRHLHGAPHVLRAVRLGLPTVVLVRRPEDAVLSYLIRRDTLAPEDAVLEYLDFYRTAWRARDGFVVAPFDRVTRDFGGIIDQVNARFGTSFRRYEHTPESEARAFELVEEMNREETGGAVRESHVGRPSDERAGRKAELRESLRGPRTAARLREAEEIFGAYLELAATGSG